MNTETQCKDIREGIYALFPSTNNHHEFRASIPLEHSFLHSIRIKRRMRTNCSKIATTSSASQLTLPLRMLSHSELLILKVLSAERDRAAISSQTVSSVKSNSNVMTPLIVVSETFTVTVVASTNDVRPRIVSSSPFPLVNANRFNPNAAANRLMVIKVNMSRDLEYLTSGLSTPNLQVQHDSTAFMIRLEV